MQLATNCSLRYLCLDLLAGKANNLIGRLLPIRLAMNCSKNIARTARGAIL